jgi:hypothetical protein
MPTTPATGDTIAWTVEEQFLDLICSDEDLIQTEFDAIIAAEWPNPPANTPGRAPLAGTPPAGQPGARPPGSPARWPGHHPGIGGWTRQRSPPAATTTTDDRKDR